MSFLDENFPVTSGRDYRVIKFTKENLYAIYFYYTIERETPPMGKTYFLYTFLKSIKIHHSEDESVCEHCHRFKELMSLGVLSLEQQRELDKLIEHRSRFHDQIQFYLDEKRKLVANEDFSTLIVVQDFTQIKVQGTFFQDQIVCFYFYDPNAPGKLGRLYRHYIAPSSRTKNDSLFVFGVWREMVKKNYFSGFLNLLVFSDGGPKHYKMTGTMNFFGFLANSLGINLTYNFFESNHGHSVCDGAAAQAKQYINRFQRDHETTIDDPEGIVTAINRVQNHEASVAEVEKEKHDFATFAGIRSALKFTYTPTQAFGYSRSKHEEPQWEWPLDIDHFRPLELAQ